MVNDSIYGIHTDPMGMVMFPSGNTYGFLLKEKGAGKVSCVPIFHLEVDWGKYGRILWDFRIAGRSMLVNDG